MIQFAFVHIVEAFRPLSRSSNIIYLKVCNRKPNQTITCWHTHWTTNAERN